LQPASAWYRSYCSVGAVVAVPRPSFTQKWMKVLRSSWIWRFLFIRHCASSLLLIAKMSDLLIECESIEFCEPTESVSSDCAEVDCLSVGAENSIFSGFRFEFRAVRRKTPPSANLRRTPQAWTLILIVVLLFTPERSSARRVHRETGRQRPKYEGLVPAWGANRGRELRARCASCLPMAGAAREFEKLAPGLARSLRASVGAPGPETRASPRAARDREYAFMLAAARGKFLEFARACHRQAAKRNARVAPSLD